jgi:acyl-CoA synthetase (AMP-forming)/AMP-acid ligase II
VWLLTSGTTGRPKRVGHTLETLTTVTTPQPPRTWLLPYSPGTYAWWQLVTLSLSQPGQDLVCVEPDELDRWPERASREGVTAVSATPTFWRQALWSSGPALRELQLAQVTLGGEPVDQAVLNSLRETFPGARISWIYASSEAGASIAVHDGLAGFPQAWLSEARPGRPVLRVEGEELVIESPHHGAGLAGVIRTGDRVTIADGRVHIVGRLAGDEINVGGSKVSAATVRDVLQTHPAVAWASVRGRRAPIVGTIVAADVVLSRQVDEDELVAHCQRSLPDYAVPRRFRFLDEIPVKETLKSDV